MYVVKVDGNILYHPRSTDKQLTEAKLTLEVGKAGSFDFSVPDENDSVIREKLSRISVHRYKLDSFGNPTNENIIYRGVPNKFEDGYSMETEWKSDGVLTLLNDSYVRPFASATRMRSEWLKYFVNYHNGYCGHNKTFVIRDLDIIDRSVSRSSNEYKTTKSMIDSLVSDYGGEISVSYTKDENVLTWKKKASITKGNQTLRQGHNVIDLSRYIDGYDIITRIIPLGKTKEDGTPLTIESVNNGKDYIEDTVAVRSFGIIESAVTFSDCDNATELMKLGNMYLGKYKYAELSYEVTAADLAEFGYSVDSLNIGDYVPVVIPKFNVSDSMRISKMVINLLKPESSTITLGSTMKTYTQAQIDSITGNNKVIDMD